MRHAIRLSSALLLLVACSIARAAGIPSPSEYLKMPIGADRVVADYRQIRAYFAELDRLSPRVQVENLGKTTLGEDLVMAMISSEANLARLPRLKEIAHRLADPRGLSDADLDALVREGRAFVLVTCNIHSTEIGASQMAMEWAHALATANDAETLRRLDQVVLLLVPSLNPDGQIMETEWYRKYLGTRYEGGRMPWLYHHYVGHDDNRDWFMLTQKETQAMSRAVYHEWFPQVWLDEHQMGSTGPRLFLPPYSEPVAPEIHPLVWREVNLIGAQMALRLEQARKSGVIYGYAFDAYWPGGTKNTAWFKNVAGLLTELASARFASPLYVDANELAGGRKGLVEYEAQTNFPNPWPGGWWRLRDIMDYERIASDALLGTCAERREDVLRDMAARARASIAPAAPGEAFRLPRGQRDWATALRLAALLVEHNVETYESADGDLWVPLAQPYGAFVREMLGTQRYPEVKLVPGPEIVRPYDVAAWSLPLMMGVTVERAALPAGARPYVPAAAGAAAPSGAAALAPGAEAARALNAALRSGGHVSLARAATVLDGTTWPAGTAFLDRAAAAAAAKALNPGVTLAPIAGAPAGGAVLAAPRVALYKPWAVSMDEGWTRFLLERYGFEPATLDNAAIRKGGLRTRFDAIVLPDVAKEIIATGRPKHEEGAMAYFTELPPEYAGGLDTTGARALRQFVEAGGTLVALASSCAYVTEQFNIPVVNTLAAAKPETFACPGSLLRASVQGDHPVTFGLPREVALFVDQPIAFQTAPPAPELDRWVLATYPDDPRTLLLSGWIRGEELLTRRAAAVALTYGKGRLVLLGFRAQHRAQTDATFPFLFNALYWSAMRE
ncbi:MAG: hypothetical protein HZC42_12920 [Candidatus Eisenbacteria bacterium]|nr:hypothetical protein [Candidatus Eisenbacteria bacterium]